MYIVFKKVRRIIYFSSASVYGEDIPHKRKIDENIVKDTFYIQDLLSEVSRDAKD